MKRHWSERTSGYLFLLVLDFLIVFDSLALGYLLRFQWAFWDQPAVPQAPVGAYLQAWAVVTYLVLFLFHSHGLYDRRKVRDPIEALRPILAAGTGVLLLLLALSYFYRGFSYSRLALVYSCVAGLCLFTLFRCGWESYRRRLRSLGHSQKRVILVGGRTLPKFLSQRFAEDPSYGYSVCAVIDKGLVDPSFLPDTPKGSLEDLERLLEETAADEVLIGHPAVGHHQLLRMIDTCERFDRPIRMVPATYDLHIDSSDFEEIGGIPLVTVNERRAKPLYRVTKRAVDIVLASIGLIVTAPLLALVALTIRVDSPGPSIYRQRRVGRHGATFQMLKFRTMVVGAEELLPALVSADDLEEPVFKLEQDPRVTRLGKYLRCSSVDELPQLWNVLKGEMSLVGPRPEEESMVARYDIWERRRLKLAPGITGLQQLHCRGSQSLKERVRWDILYLRKESMVLDLWVLFKTIGAVISRRGAR